MIAEVATVPARRAWARPVVAVAVPALTVAWLGTHRAMVDRGTATVRDSTGGWLLGAMAVTALTWFATAVVWVPHNRDVI